MNAEKPQATHQEQDELQFERIVFFSDAVFAIAITLLVIEIKVPEMGHHLASHSASVEELYQQWPGEFVKLFPKIFGFILSFLVIGQYWINHHRNFGIIRRFDRGLLWRNLLFLMCIAFIPFTTAFYSEYTYWSIPLMWYSANIALTGLMQWWVWKYASRNARLIDPSTNPHLIDQISLGHLGVPVAFSLSFIGGLLGYPFSISFTWVVIPLMIRFAHWRYERRIASQPV
ncbi:TMEM175 family protein [Larkinella terrae]|uniref:DUF1211 domain-containing protein n=1 Tax=Larkinella terrae TaxID=2025311 RepID=A0A7K0EEK1_9BACT|nr:TMEM175 family protein [Larkinella terrae]MRS59888.1 DUF1211 domain-containing protein [Larkinella terrae]